MLLLLRVLLLLPLLEPRDALLTRPVRIMLLGCCCCTLRPRYNEEEDDDDVELLLRVADWLGLVAVPWLRLVLLETERLVLFETELFVVVVERPRTAVPVDAFELPLVAVP